MRIIEYLSRIGHARGFGIQSPWAYSFVTEVIGEKWPYYAYEEIDRRYKRRGERRRQKLYYRICNFVYGSRVYVTDLRHVTNDDILLLAEKASPGGVLIIENIYDRETAGRWQRLKEQEFIGVTFDLYDFAICFLDRSIYKQHYKLNF